MSTMAIKSAVTMDHVKSGKKADFVSRFKKYMEDNVAYFAAGSAMMTGNGYAAGQIIKNARRQLLSVWRFFVLTFLFLSKSASLGIKNGAFNKARLITPA